LAGDGTSQMAITSDGTCSHAEAEGARALSELQDGRLWLGSREGASCTLSFTVPLPSNEQALSRLLMVAEEGHMTSLAKKILIVDDEPDIVVALAAVLQDAGYLVSTQRDGEQLESVLAREQPQLILLDMLLSGRDGREIVRQLKGQAATRDVPILMLSAYPSAAREALAAGADDFLAKPFDLDELLQKVTAHIA